MKIFTFAFAYLTLSNERGRPVYLKDLFVVGAGACLIALPFLTLSGAPFFSKDGFLDKFSAFSGVLTGFYVAALIAVATLSSTSADLDGPIESGAVFFPKKSVRAGKRLSRRQYVCLMFGYLAFVSVVLSLVAALSVSLVTSVKSRTLVVSVTSLGRFNFDLNQLRPWCVIFVSVVVSHMVVTTMHGLYYLTDRLYARKPRMLPREGGKESDTN